MPPHKRAGLGAAHLAALVALALLLVPSPALAQANTALPTSGSAQVLYSVTLDDVSSIVTARNRVVTRDNSARRPVLRVYLNAADQARSAVHYNVSVAACDTANRPPGCMGVSLFRVSPLAATDRERMRRFSDAFHSRFSYARVYPLETNGRSLLVLDYYVMVDDGVTRAHLSRVLNEWEGIINEFITLWSQTQ